MPKFLHARPAGHPDRFTLNQPSSNFSILILHQLLTRRLSDLDWLAYAYAYAYAYGRGVRGGVAVASFGA